ncbi:hypothetical protein [Krasilnikovia sp. M28-CT-15]|uniref:hypothetical protein n=1 Tax=Krasilnikovia sp. M28-CT-15 TaxID=3373540 RepID=UPI00399C6DCD
MTRLVQGSGRPLLPGETWPVDATVEEDRRGLLTGVLTIGEYTVRVFQPADGSADLHLAVTTADGDDYGLAVTVDGEPVLDAMPGTWTSTVPADLRPPSTTRRR